MDSTSKNDSYIITGGPGVGKTTLIWHLQQKLFALISDVARKIIQQQLRLGGQ